MEVKVQHFNNTDGPALQQKSQIAFIINDSMNS